MNTDSRAFYHGFILMYDTNGKLIKSISIVTTTNNVEQLGLFQVTSIFSFDQDSLIIGGVVAQTMSSIGFSVDSFYDEGVFKFDSQGNFIWGTAIDYNIYYDSDWNVYVYGSEVYISFFSNTLYLCFAHIDGNNGTLIRSSWVNFPYITTSDISSNSHSFLDLLLISLHFSIHHKLI